MDRPCGRRAFVAAATGIDAAPTRTKAPVDEAIRATRQRFLEMFARAYFPGRTGQLLVVPREGDFITRPDPYLRSNARHALALRRRHSLDVHGPCGEGGSVLDGRGAARHRTDACRRAGCQDAADRDRACLAGAPEGLRSTAGDHAAGSGRYASRLFRPPRRVNANPDRPAPAQRVVHSGAGQRPPQ